MEQSSLATEFDLLFALHRRAIFAHVLMLIGNQNDAADVFQETAETLWQKFDQYQPDTDFRAWAYRIGYYKVLKHRERREGSPRLLGLEVIDLLDEESVVMSDVLDAHSAALEKCRQKLSNVDRDLLTRFYDREQSARRVAQYLRLSTHQVYRALRRVHDLLFDCISKTLAEDSNG